MRRLIPLLLLATSPAFAAPRPVDGVVALVEGRPITALQVRRRAAPALAQLRVWSGPAWRKDALLRETLGKTLESMIEELLLVRAAQLAHLTPPEVNDAALDRMAAEAGWSRAQLLTHWEAQGYSRERLLEETRRGWLRQLVLRDAWRKEHAEPEPSEPSEALDAWRSRWIESLKRRATIERRVP